MKYGNVWVSVCEDCGENEGGFFCQVYSDENMENEIDSFCICPDYCDCNDDEAVEKYIEWYLGIEK